MARDRAKAARDLARGVNPQRGRFTIVNPSKRALARIEAKRRSRQTPQGAQAWQTDAFEAARLVPELGYVVNTKASALARCGYPVEQKVDGKWVPATDERAIAAMEALVGPSGSMSEIVRRFGQHMEIGGESTLVGTTIRGDVPDGSPPGTLGKIEGIVWEFLSPLEVRTDNQGRTERRSVLGGWQVIYDERKAAEAAKRGEDDGQDTLVARCWWPDPELTDLPDSPIRWNLPVAREIIVLTQVIDAILKARLAAGIFYVPDEIEFVPTDEDDDEPFSEEDDEEDTASLFVAKLIEHLSAAKEDYTSPASLVPLVVRGPGDAKQYMGLIEVARALDSWAANLRDEAISRLGQGLDVPPEVLNGKAGTNHWVGWNIDFSFVTQHVAPTGEKLADFLTINYLRPMLTVFENVSQDEAVNFRVGFDPEPALARPDDSATARSLYGVDAINAAALRRASGYRPEDAMEGKELFVTRALRLILAAPQVYAKALLPLIPGFENVDLDLLELPAGGGDAGGGAPPDGAPAAPAGGPPPERRADPVPPQPQPGRNPGTGESSLSGVAELEAQLLAAADAMLEWAIDRAASRVVSRAQRADQATKDLLAGVPAGIGDKRRILASLSPSQLAKLGCGYDTLFPRDAWDGLRQRSVTWIEGHLLELGVDAAAARRLAIDATEAIAVGLDTFNRQSIHRAPRTYARGMSVPPEIVTVAVAGAMAAPEVAAAIDAADRAAGAVLVPA